MEDADDDQERRADLARAYGRITSEDYAARWAPSNRGNQLALEDRNEVIAAALGERVQLQDTLVLDIGYGSGSLVARLEGQTRVGLDLLLCRLQGVVTTDPLVNADASALPFCSGAFDVAVMFTMLTSVPDVATRRRIAMEIDRVLAPGALIVWYDFRYPSPFNHAVRRVGRQQLSELFPQYALDLRSTTVLPPLARRLGRFTDGLYPVLSKMPVLRSHLAGTLTKPGVPGS